MKNHSVTSVSSPVDNSVAQMIRPTQSSLIYAYCTGAIGGFKHTRKEAQVHFGVSQAWISKALTVHCKRYGLPLVPDERVKPC